MVVYLRPKATLANVAFGPGGIFDDFWKSGEYLIILIHRNEKTFIT